MREETERRGGSRRSAPPGEGGGGKMAALRRRDGGWGHRTSPERLVAGAGDRQRGALAPPSRAAAAFCPDRQKPDRPPPPVPCRGRAGRPRARLAAGRSATRSVGDANGRGRPDRPLGRAQGCKLQIPSARCRARQCPRQTVLLTPPRSTELYSSARSAAAPRGAALPAPGPTQRSLGCAAKPLGPSRVPLPLPFSLGR